MVRLTPSLAQASRTEDHSILRFDDAPEFSVGHVLEEPRVENMDQQVREAQERLARLRAEQEEVERQRQILETLKQKQERFVSGRQEITSKLDRSLRAIQEEMEGAQRYLEDLSITQQEFQERLNELKTFLPERWQRGQLDQELDKAISSLIEAETSFEKGIRRVSLHRPTDGVSQAFSDADAGESGVLASPFASALGHSDDLLSWAKRGFAFTLPLMATLLLVVILAKLMF